MKPTIGRIVHYRLAAHDIGSIRESLFTGGHAFTPLHAGQTVPMLVTTVHTPTNVSGRLFLDADGPLPWIRHAEQGLRDGQWAWPPRKTIGPFTTGGKA